MQIRASDLDRAKNSWNRFQAAAGFFDRRPPRVSLVGGGGGPPHADRFWRRAGFAGQESSIVKNVRSGLDNFKTLKKKKKAFLFFFTPDPR